ncbi:type 2 lanthipeptide synthetase LanM family protein [Amycolatopsis sp. NPDC058278]|uniref:type 2 lanthipeptide synthetase LanM family protein n=1 Tax=Amycolatopsis sp. NPDC058278 TaxID=3346417 RepID=UPI0036DD61FD
MSRVRSSTPAAHSPGAGARCFRPVVRPLVEAAARRLGDAPAVVVRGFEDWLGDRLCSFAARTLVARLRADREGLAGEDARARFADFVARVSLADVLAEHPGLEALLTAVTHNAVGAATELLTRLDDDRDALAGLAGGDAGVLTSVVFGRGDAHGHGRTVCELGFASGARVIYRPRPAGLHARWNELLADLAPILGALAPGRAEVLERPGYAWVEYISARPAGDVGRYYRRLGAQLALLHVLGATDIHAENVVAAGEHPVVVDVETLFQPRWTPHTDGGHDPALTAVETSVLNTFVLPRPVFGPHGRLDLSAFGARPGWFPYDLPGWAGAGTDRMRLVRGPAPYTAGHHRPGPDVDPAAHGGDLVDGFRAGYRRLAAHRDVLARGLDRFAGTGLRIIPRASEWYADLLRESTEPAFLREIDGRQQAFAALGEVTAYPYLGRFAEASRADLAEGDIPFFVADVDGRDVRTTTGTLLPDVLETDGLTAARGRIDRLGERDLRAQLWFARAAIATLTPPGAHTTPPGHTAGGGTPDPARLLDLAVSVGDDLIGRGCTDAVRLNWPSLEPAEDGGWCVRQLGASLGDGYCGVALFLAELGRLSGHDRFLDAAARAVRPLPGLIALLDAHPALAAGVGPGAFSGLGGLAYTVGRLAGLLDDRAFAELVPAALRAAAVAARETELADVGDGIAGTLLAASAATHAGPGRADAAALVAELADRLEHSAPLPTAGFRFGRAGVVHALRLAGRVPPAGGDGVDGLGWCTGLAGLVLAGADPGSRVVARFRAALRERVPSADHSLCHGELGVLDAARLVGEPVRLPRGALACGTPGAVPTPGLLHGLAGIGHGLLRLGFAGRVPAISLLAPETPSGVSPEPDSALVPR